jgi:hypothetical protein
MKYRVILFYIILIISFTSNIFALAPKSIDFQGLVALANISEFIGESLYEEVKETSMLEFLKEIINKLLEAEEITDLTKIEESQKQLMLEIVSVAQENYHRNHLFYKESLSVICGLKLDLKEKIKLINKFGKKEFCGDKFRNLVLNRIFSASITLKNSLKQRIKLFEDIKKMILSSKKIKKDPILESCIKEVWLELFPLICKRDSFIASFNFSCIKGLNEFLFNTSKSVTSKEKKNMIERFMEILELDPSPIRVTFALNFYSVFIFDLKFEKKKIWIDILLEILEIQVGLTSEKFNIENFSFANKILKKLFGVEQKIGIKKGYIIQQCNIENIFKDLIGFLETGSFKQISKKDWLCMLSNFKKYDEVDSEELLYFYMFLVGKSSFSGTEILQQKRVFVKRRLFPMNFELILRGIELDRKIRNNTVEDVELQKFLKDIAVYLSEKINEYSTIGGFLELSKEKRDFKLKEYYILIMFINYIEMAQKNIYTQDSLLEELSRILNEEEIETAQIVKEDLDEINIDNDELWSQLIKRGYIDKQGIIQNKFVTIFKQAKEDTEQGGKLLAIDLAVDKSVVYKKIADVISVLPFSEQKLLVSEDKEFSYFFSQIVYKTFVRELGFAIEEESVEEGNWLYYTGGFEKHEDIEYKQLLLFYMFLTGKSGFVPDLRLPDNGVSINFELILRGIALDKKIRNKIVEDIEVQKFLNDIREYITEKIQEYSTLGIFLELSKKERDFKFKEYCMLIALLNHISMGQESVYSQYSLIKELFYILAKAEIDFAKVSKDDLKEFVVNQEDLWSQLVEKGYIDAQGIIQDKFVRIFEQAKENIEKGGMLLGLNVDIDIFVVYKKIAEKYKKFSSVNSSLMFQEQELSDYSKEEFSFFFSTIAHELGHRELDCLLKGVVLGNYVYVDTDLEQEKNKKYIDTESSEEAFADLRAFDFLEQIATTKLAGTFEELFACRRERLYIPCLIGEVYDCGIEIKNGIFSEEDIGILEEKEFLRSSGDDKKEIYRYNYIKKDFTDDFGNELGKVLYNKYMKVLLGGRIVFKEQHDGARNGIYYYFFQFLKHGYFDVRKYTVQEEYFVSIDIFDFLVEQKILEQGEHDNLLIKFTDLDCFIDFENLEEFNQKIKEKLAETFEVNIDELSDKLLFDSDIDLDSQDWSDTMNTLFQGICYLRKRPNPALSYEEVTRRVVLILKQRKQILKDKDAILNLSLEELLDSAVCYFNEESEELALSA